MPTIDNDVSNDFARLALQPKCLFLTKLPPEIRVLIYEHVFRRENGVIVYNLLVPSDCPERRREIQGILLTSRQIYQECAAIEYEVNDIHIFAPVFSTLDMFDRRDVVARLRDPSLIARFSANSRVYVSLGRIWDPLGTLKWINFFQRWQSVWEILSDWRGKIGKLLIVMKLRLKAGVANVATYTFGVDSVKEVEEGFERGIARDGSVVELDEKELERLMKMKMSIIKLGFGGQSEVEGKSDPSR